MKLKSVLFALLIAAVASSGCGFITAKVPVLKPIAATSLTVGLSALADVLKTQPNVPTSVFDAITVAQRAIAQDVSGATWGAIAREALVTVYSDLPVATQNDQTVAALVDGLEIALATVGA